MISFACRAIQFQDLLRCSFGLNKTDYAVYMLMLSEKRERMAVSEIADRAGKERTVIQKSMKRLFERNLIKRFQENLESGGYRFYYSPVEKREVKARLMQSVRSWVENVESAVNHW
jgi:predicted transcriptional regulator